MNKFNSNEDNKNNIIANKINEQKNLNENKKDNKKNIIKSILSTIPMFLLISFFSLYNAKGIYKISGWITVIYLSFCYFMLLKTNKISYWRRFLFILGAFCFFPSFIAMLLEKRGSMALEYKDIFLNETPFCHIVFPMVIVPYLLENVLIFPARLTGHYASFYAMLVIICVSILTIGRGWCSWVCFYGGWDESFSLLSKKPILKLEDSSKKIRFFNFVMLFVVILGALATFSVIYCQWFCPWKLITEYEQITNLSSFFSLIMSVIIFFSLVIVFSFLTKKRVQCMSFCPFGALASILDKLSFFRVKINNEKCISCGKCSKVCPFLSIDENSIKEKKGKIFLTCSKCGNCIDNCPTGAISYDFFFKHKNATIKISKSLIIFAGWLLGSIVMGGFISDTIARILNLIINGTFFMY